MKKKSNKVGKILVRVIAVLIAVLAVIGMSFYIYTLDYYRADESVEEILNLQNVEVIDEGIVIHSVDVKSDIGLIFYPGGKVEFTAYLPLLEQISRNGITCVLVEMPFNLAVFDSDAADNIYNDFPEINEWYLCGHSLGGAMASNYMENNEEKIEGLIILGAYPINGAEVDTLVIYGTEDIELDLTKLEVVENKIEIKGGNHAYFGNYGEQEGDGEATITREEQQSIAVDEIVDFIKN